MALKMAIRLAGMAAVLLASPAVPQSSLLDHLLNLDATERERVLHEAGRTARENAQAGVRDGNYYTRFHGTWCRPSGYETIWERCDDAQSAMTIRKGMIESPERTCEVTNDYVDRFYVMLKLRCGGAMETWRIRPTCDFISFSRIEASVR
jgi:hypothetical protein